jgi:hypothetical protein
MAWRVAGRARAALPRAVRTVHTHSHALDAFEAIVAARQSAAAFAPDAVDAALLTRILAATLVGSSKRGGGGGEGGWGAQATPTPRRAPSRPPS